MENLQTTELRIGNLVMQNGFYGYVYSIGSPEPRKEKRFSDKAIITLFDNGLTTVPIDEIEPIPLTEEILLKLGFKQNEQFKTNFKFYLKDNEIEINIYNGNNNSWLNDRYVINLKYVHQLQNLFFSLCGEELTVK
jgi:hypothetical protein